MHKNTQSLFEQLYVPVVSFIKDIVEDQEEAENIAVELFACNIDELNTYGGSDDGGEIIQVLLKKALIESIRFLRKKKGEREAEKIFQEQSDNFEASVEDAKIEQELRMLLEKAGGKLTKQQNLVLNYYFSDVPTNIASRIMEISTSTFRSTKQAALKKYKAMLKSGGFRVFIILLILVLWCVNQ
jgi:RNA polymerase sigma factor (sigma-70 family)